ncbi:response regulator [Leucobacter edaphi]|uniref:response regulator n=1 Tax=Leucobacter edaphi TaxID=2796472 RepID=UPI0034E2DE76
MVLDGEPDFEVIGEAEDGAQAVQLSDELDPDVILMDVHMPGTDGIVATERICGERTCSRVIAITAFDVDDHAFGMLRAGASGFLLKDAGPDALCAAVRAVHAGDAVVSPRVTRRLIDRFVHRLPSPCAPGCHLGELTSREAEILGAIGEGLNNTELAERFTLSESTVKTHVGRILKKLHLRDRVQAVLYACRTSHKDR